MPRKRPETKRSKIAKMLIEEYQPQSAQDIQEALKDLLWRHYTTYIHIKNKGSPKTADIYLSVPLLWSFLFDLALSSILKLFICPNMDFLSLS